MKFYPNWSEWKEKDLFMELFSSLHVNKAPDEHFTTDEIKLFLREIGNPEEKLRAVHVAGTNGKGSVSSFISSAYLESGKKVGTFLSPHMVDFRERTLVNCRLPEKDRLFQTLEEIAEYRPKGLSEFELSTALMFRLFEKEKVDLAVLEVGMGGTRDATNVCRPMAGVITSISLDHTQFLGKTVKKIAGEKAGIIKEGMKVFMGTESREALGVVEKKCREQGAELHTVDYSAEITNHSLKGITADYRFSGQEQAELSTTMPGLYQVANMAKAYSCCRLGLEEREIKKGFSKAFIPIRFQVERIKGKTIILDAAHNPEGMETLVETIKALGLERKITAVFNCRKDKDCSAMLEKLARITEEIIAPGFEKGTEVAKVLKTAKQNGIKNSTAVSSIISALEKALGGGQETVLVCGSIYMIGELFSWNLLKSLRSR